MHQFQIQLSLDIKVIVSNNLRQRSTSCHNLLFIATKIILRRGRRIAISPAIMVSNCSMDPQCVSASITTTPEDVRACRSTDSKPREYNESHLKAWRSYASIFSRSTLSMLLMIVKTSRNVGRKRK
mmetsp:Transcript_14503/g.35348  ORF Transcript_14503/g.35348 Transcript_14503/m.35348 type:complete len:126 (+) Transcript_14503:281-658(+)